MDTNGKQKISDLLASRCPVILVQTHEIDDAVAWLVDWANGDGRFAMVWSLLTGLQVVNMTIPDARRGDAEANIRAAYDNIGLPVPSETAGDPTRALRAALSMHRSEEHRRRAIIILENFTHWFADPEAVEAIRISIDELGKHVRNPVSIIIVEPEPEIPTVLKTLVEVVDWSRPRAEELIDSINAAANVVGLPTENGGFGLPVDISDGGDEKLANAIKGLTRRQVDQVLRYVIHKTRGLCADRETLDILIDHKRAALKQTGGMLEFYDTADMVPIGGLDLLQSYIAEMRGMFDKEAIEFAGGLDIASRGVFLFGPPGTGKSLSSKAIAQVLGLPMVRFSIGKVYDKYLGSSEDRLKQVLDMIETLAPCVLFIDELDKAFPGDGGEVTGGTPARVMGEFLTWMQEKARQNGVMVVGTANYLNLDPALLSRFDEQFYVPLPGFNARRDIFSIHLARAGRTDLESLGIDIDELANMTRMYSGREIENIVLTAMRKAFNAVKAGESSDITQEHLLASIDGITPVSKTKRQQMEIMRRYAASARPASSEPPDSVIEDFEPAILANQDGDHPASDRFAIT